jgi:hypothetical protein
MENEESLLSVLSNTGIENLLTSEEALTIQTRLLDILANRVDSYQRGGSCSVRIETAQELLRSAGFVISHGLRYGLVNGDKTLRAGTLRTAMLHRKHSRRGSWVRIMMRCSERG